MKVIIKTMNTKNFEKKTLKCFGWTHFVKSVKNKYKHIMGTCFLQTTHTKWKIYADIHTSEEKNDLC